MASKELTNLVKDLSQKIINAPNELEQSERNEEWTKVVLILPLLKGLGWDSATDIIYESRPDDTEGRLDFILKSQPQIGVEAKALDESFPKDHNHSQVKKGLKQSKNRGASYFIWSNGDCWQFYSLALENAPVYQVIISSTSGSDISTRSGSDHHNFLNPDFLTSPIRAAWFKYKNSFQFTARQR